MYARVIPRAWLADPRGDAGGSALADPRGDSHPDARGDAGGSARADPRTRSGDADCMCGHRGRLHPMG